MADNGKQKSGWLLFVYALGYALCFVIPAAGLSMLFPHYVPYIVGTAGILMLSGAGLIVSQWWDRADMTNGARKQIRDMAFVFLTVIPGISIVSDCLQKHSWHRLRFGLGLIAVMVVAVYVPFFLGRAISRRRKLKADG